MLLLPCLHVQEKNFATLFGICCTVVKRNGLVNQVEFLGLVGA